jgi:hypothetical protein
MATADVCAADTGRVVAKLKSTMPSKLAGVPPDDNLWGVTGGLGFDLEKGAAFLVSAPPPAFTGGEVELSPKGVRAK